jgi:hypothetical protein
MADALTIGQLIAELQKFPEGRLVSFRALDMDDEDVVYEPARVVEDTDGVFIESVNYVEWDDGEMEVEEGEEEEEE